MIDLSPFGVSLSLAAWVTAILLVVSFPLAWILARSRRRWVALIDAFCSIGLVLPPTVSGFYFLICFSPLSPLGHLLEASLGIRLVFSFPGLVIAACVASFPFMFAALKAGAAAVPESLLETAWTLGKGRLTTVWLVGLPQMRTALVAGCIVTFAHTLGEFGVVMMVGGSIPGVTKTASIAIFEDFEAGHLGEAHVYALILVVTSYLGSLILNLLQRHERRRLA